MTASIHFLRRMFGEEAFCDIGKGALLTEMVRYYKLWFEMS